jgi:hypothetical protein
MPFDSERAVVVTVSVEDVSLPMLRQGSVELAGATKDVLLSSQLLRPPSKRLGRPSAASYSRSECVSLRSPSGLPADS